MKTANVHRDCKSVGMRKKQGLVDVPVENCVTFVRGILGFEEFREYFVLDLTDSNPFKIMHSMEEDGPSFVLFDTTHLPERYHPELLPGVMEELDFSHRHSCIVFSILTLSEDPSQITANLKGPILINTENRLAKQVILMDDRYPVKYRLGDCASKLKPSNS